MNALFQGAVSAGQIDKEKAIAEIDALIKWQEDRKKWHHDKTRQKMAAEGALGIQDGPPGALTFKSSDFGLDDVRYSFKSSFNYTSMTKLTNLQKSRPTLKTSKSQMMPPMTPAPTPTAKTLPTTTLIPSLQNGNAAPSVRID